MSLNLAPSAVDFEAMTAEALMAQVVEGAPSGSVCFTCSFQTEDMVVLHLLRQRVPDVPVIFLETGYHFKEVIEYRDRMTAEWGLNLVNAMPLTTLKEHEGKLGLLYLVNPTECCRIRKVEPLMRALEPFDWWFTGLRREPSPSATTARASPAPPSCNAPCNTPPCSACPDPGSSSGACRGSSPQRAGPPSTRS